VEQEAWSRRRLQSTRLSHKIRTGIPCGQTPTGDLQHSCRLFRFYMKLCLLLPKTSLHLKNSSWLTLDVVKAECLTIVTPSDPCNWNWRLSDPPDHKIRHTRWHSIIK
jgi:hypothetical protein